MEFIQIYETILFPYHRQVASKKHAGTHFRANLFDFNYGSSLL